MCPAAQLALEVLFLGVPYGAQLALENLQLVSGTAATQLALDLPPRRWPRELTQLALESDPQRPSEMSVLQSRLEGETALPALEAPSRRKQNQFCPIGSASLVRPEASSALACLLSNGALSWAGRSQALLRRQRRRRRQQHRQRR